MEWSFNNTTTAMAIQQNALNETRCIEVTHDNVGDFTYSRVDIAMVTVFMPIVFVVGVIGNAMVVYVFFRVTHMRTVTNYYLASLAMADLFFLCSAVPVFWVQYSFTNVPIDHTALGVGVCKVVLTFSPDVCFIVSTMTVVVLTIERYVAICWPMKFKTISTKPKAVTTIVLTWVLAALYKSPQIYFAGVMANCFDWSQYTNSSEYPSDVITCDFCSIQSHGMRTCEIWRRSLTLDNLLILMVIPVILILYFFIALQLYNLSKSTTGSAASSTRMKQQVIRMLMVTIATYIICITPFRVLNLLNIWSYKIPPNMKWALVNMARILQYTNAAVNPIIYNIMSDKYRQSFKQAFGFICESPPKESAPVTQNTKI
ncbi:growth hormone secretagogue receptor type 1-like isoform X2 [Ptychodera flava]|uniref:growth hormone secretagogue receptor type 1-like isoform X2 n=1 Tax=Ptychodera flava TaxID=63121 RepID=UPI00396A758F